MVLVVVVVLLNGIMIFFLEVLISVRVCGSGAAMIGMLWVRHLTIPAGWERWQPGLLCRSDSLVAVFRIRLSVLVPGMKLR